jgi:hypothetical protein
MRRLGGVKTLPAEGGVLFSLKGAFRFSESAVVITATRFRRRFDSGRNPSAHTLLPFALDQLGHVRSWVHGGVHVSRCCHLSLGLKGLKAERSHRNAVCRHEGIELGGMPNQRLNSPARLALE